MSEAQIQFITEMLIQLLKVIIIFHGILLGAAGVTLLERRFAGWVQYRHGPNRVGPQGLLQPIADLIKFMFKESSVPKGAHPVLFRAAPLFAAIPSLLTFAVIPFGGAPVEIFGHKITFVGADISVAVLYVFAIGSLSVYGIILAGWASNSKYALLGGLRSSAQVISYELGMILAIVAVIAWTGSQNIQGEMVDALSLKAIIVAQEGNWNLFSLQFIGFIIFLISAFAETNRHPFDFAECESELVAGFHTEFSSMRFSLFFLGEYAAMITMSAMLATLYLGGPLVPGLSFAETPWWLGLLSFTGKTIFFLFVYLLVRWSLPRFRFDQLMNIGWKVLLPLSLVNLLLTGLWLTF